MTFRPFHLSLLTLTAAALMSCSGKGVDSAITAVDDTAPDSGLEAVPDAVLLQDGFEPLPEGLVSVNSDSTLFAQYAQPTSRYRHGILGDVIEAGQLVVAWRDSTYCVTLDDEYVFEDLVPRLIDVDGDGRVEIITIRTHVARGAGIAIYRIGAGGLQEYAQVAEVGRSSRWLNIAAVYDLDGDGTVELAWVQTPHIGGILRVARIEPGELTVLAEAQQYSNHAIGERNLRLSVVTDRDDVVTLWLPTQDRTAIEGFAFNNGNLTRTDVIALRVDFAQPLESQFGFFGVVQTGGGL